MTKSNRLGMYADVRQVLDVALAAGGGFVECSDHGAAVHWRQRAYRFRKLYAETIGARAMSQYDQLVMPRIAEDDRCVTIKVGRAPVLFRPAGDIPTPALALDPLADVAADLAARIERGDLS